jgi:hypothetical protein
MSKTIYLDTHQFVRVFERGESEKLFPLFAKTLERNDLRLIVSEGNILEIFHGVAKGADINQIREGLDRVESLQPLWLRISGLDVNELRTAFTQYQNEETYAAINPFLPWPEFLAALLKSRDASVMIDLAGSGVSGAFESLYRSGRLIREGPFWQSELDAAGEAFRRMIQGQRRGAAFREQFVETAIHACGSLSSDDERLRRFAEELWRSPGVCPGFRLTFEVTASLLGDNQSAWTTNRFFDQRHIIAIPYVDMYAGLDRGQRHAVAEFDRRVGGGAGIQYSSRCHRKIEEVLDAQAAHA